MEFFDLIIIGSGSAGYTAAIRASQLGMRVACVEKNIFGGTCLNIGCIPSKTLLNISNKYYDLLNHFNNIGIFTDVKFDLNRIMIKKNHIIREISQDIESLFIKYKVVRFYGMAKLLSCNIVSINNNSVIHKIRSNNILIATGSRTLTLPNIKLDENSIVSSVEALSFSKVPNTMLIIGGGYIAIELGLIWRRFGAKVIIIESSSIMLSKLDREIVSYIIQMLQKYSINLMCNTKVIGVQKQNTGKILVSLKKNSECITIVTDVVLIAIGRKSNSQYLGLFELGIKLDINDSIIVNNHYQTNISNIYAVGDVISGPMLAHKAQEEALLAVEFMSGNNNVCALNYHLIPNIIYTYPEVATIGFTEEELKEKRIDYEVGKFPFFANSKAKILNSTDGIVKILVDKLNHKILGAHIIGPDAGSLIAEITAFMVCKASWKDLFNTCHAYPSLNEVLKSACLNIRNIDINV